MSAHSHPVRLSPDAERDYDDILLSTFLSWGEPQMQKYRASLNQAFAKIGDYPEIGRPRDHLLPGYRSLNAEKHVIVYRFQHDRIEIVRILHERSDVARHFSS